MVIRSEFPTLFVGSLIHFRRLVPYLARCRDNRSTFFGSAVVSWCPIPIWPTVILIQVGNCFHFWLTAVLAAVGHRLQVDEPGGIRL